MILSSFCYVCNSPFHFLLVPISLFFILFPFLLLCQFVFVHFLLSSSSSLPQWCSRVTLITMHAVSYKGFTRHTHHISNFQRSEGVVTGPSLYSSLISAELPGSGVKIVLRILEVPGSNFSLDTGYPDWRISCFFSVTSGECRNSTLKLGHGRYFLYTFQLIIHLSFHPTLNLSYWRNAVK
jgi:hypothetical protein